MNDPHYNDIIISSMTSQITGISCVYSTVCCGADQIKHQSSASLAFCEGIRRGPVNYPHKRTVTRKIIPFDDVTMMGFKCITDIHVLHILSFKDNIVVAWFRCAIEQTFDDILENIATCTSNCASIFSVDVFIISWAKMAANLQTAIAGMLSCRKVWYQRLLLNSSLLMMRCYFLQKVIQRLTQPTASFSYVYT